MRIISKLLTECTACFPVDSLVNCLHAKTVAVAVTPPTATTAQDESCDTVITATTSLRKEEICICLFSKNELNQKF